MDWASLGVFISVCCASLSGVLHTLQQSRCKNIKLCGGFCLNCDREVPDIVESEPIEENNQFQIQPHNRIV